VNAIHGSLEAMRSSWSKFVIREIEPDLLPEVYEIERDSFRYPYKNSFLDWLADRYCRTFLVARNEEKVLGYVVASVEGERGHLFSVAVRPGWRNRGVGSALIRELFRRLVSSGVHGIRLEVRKDNSEARSLY